eukprot:s87_g12.t2
MMCLKILGLFHGNQRHELVAVPYRPTYAMPAVPKPEWRRLLILDDECRVWREVTSKMIELLGAFGASVVCEDLRGYAKKNIAHKITSDSLRAAGKMQAPARPVRKNMLSANTTYGSDYSFFSPEQMANAKPPLARLNKDGPAVPKPDSVLVNTGQEFCWQTLKDRNLPAISIHDASSRACYQVLNLDAQVPSFKSEVLECATTTEAVAAGEHLLEIPVRNCWTAASTERECPQVAQALSKAAARHPDCELLRSASTKIALHLLWERRRSPERTDATSQAEHRRSQLHLLGSPKNKKAETLLAWGRRDLESLTGSFWFEEPPSPRGESHRRQDEIVADLQSLLTDLGPKVAAELGLMDTPQDSAAILSGDVPRESLEAYAWARWMLKYDVRRRLGLLVNLQRFLNDDNLLDDEWDVPMNVQLVLLTVHGDVLRFHAAASELIYAALKGHVALARFLIDAGMDTDVQDVNGFTPLFIATDRGHVDFVRLLLDKHNDCTWRRASTVFHPAIRKGHVEIVDLLLQAGADKDMLNDNGCTAACVASQIEKVHWLLNAGAEKDMQSDRGCTALCLASGMELHAFAERQPGAVLRLDVKQKGEAMLTLIAERDFKAGEEVKLWHRGLSCSQGFRLLMGLGRQLKVPEKKGEGEAPSQASSPWESVEVLLRLPVSAKDSSETSQLWDSIEILEGALQASRPWDAEPLLPGDAVPPDYGLRRVEVIEPDPETTHPDKDCLADGEDLLEVQVSLPLGSGLPSSTALEQIGLLICADADRMQKVMQVEKDVLNPLGSKACQGRALSYLTRRLQWALEDSYTEAHGSQEYPSAAEADARALSRAAKAEAGALPRRVRGLLLVASERQLVTQAAARVQEAIDGLASQEEEDPMAGEALPMSAEPDQGPAKAEVKSSAVEEINPEDNTIYSLDWDEGEAGESGKEVAIRSPRFQSSGARAFRASPAVEDLAARSRQRSNLKGRKPNQRVGLLGTCGGDAGLVWLPEDGLRKHQKPIDLALEQIVGFTLPVLADVTWQPGPLAPEHRAGLPRKPGYVQDSDKKGEIFTPVPDLYERSSSPVKRRMLAQKEGSSALALPATAETAVPGALGMSRMWVAGYDSKFLPRLAAGAAISGDGNATKLDGYDVLVVPLAGWLQTKTEQLCVDLLTALQAIVQQIPRSGSIRILLLTSLAMGPGSSTYRRTTVPPQAAVPILWLDSDATGTDDLQEQLMYEIGWAFPAGGPQLLNDIERAQLLLAHNRDRGFRGLAILRLRFQSANRQDVAYRQARRWLPRLDMSPKMPIYAGRVLSPLPQFVIETGVALITGGVGGIGLAAAEAMAELGLRRLVLTSRTGQVPSAQGTEERMEALRSSGVNVVVEACDVAEESSVLALLERIQDTHGPLRVVVHASGLIEEILGAGDCRRLSPTKTFLLSCDIDSGRQIDDRSIYDQDADSFRKVFEPKALGAWHLHRHTMGDRLHAFVLCSSVAALFGSRGQANYAAASAYLDELARLRTAHDLPAVSLQWPAIDPWPEETFGEGYWNGLSSGLDKKTAKSSISLSVVRQVFKLAVAGAKDPGEPVQAVLPGAYLSPTSTTVRSLLEPLLARRKAGSTWSAEPGALRTTAREYRLTLDAMSAMSFPKALHGPPASSSTILVQDMFRLLQAARQELQPPLQHFEEVLPGTNVGSVFRSGIRR